MTDRIELAMFQVGTIVTLKMEILGNPKGVKGFVYECYKNGGISVITEKGTDLGGFSLDEQMNMLSYYTDTGKHYAFRSVMYLADDFRNGLFNEFFTLPKYIRDRDKK
jgi:hypothetical protein